MQFDISFNDKEFEQLRSLVFQHTGIHLDQSKRDLVYNRFAKRMRNIGVNSFIDYFKYIDEHEDSEIEHFTNAITTNLTSFFREVHHFEILAEQVIPILRNKLDRRIRIWSAGCSTGEEPYSIALTLLHHIPDIAEWDIKILATDIDTEVVNTAAQGIYSMDKLKNIPDTIKQNWLHKGVKEISGGEFKMTDTAKALITFKRLNLMNEWPMKGPFDVIFCRNVVIYFDKSTQSSLFEKFSDMQYKNAYLFVGHSENLMKITDKYDLASKTVYQKI